MYGISENWNAEWDEKRTVSNSKKDELFLSIERICANWFEIDLHFVDAERIYEENTVGL